MNAQHPPVYQCLQRFTAVLSAPTALLMKRMWHQCKRPRHQGQPFSPRASGSRTPPCSISRRWHCRIFVGIHHKSHTPGSTRATTHSPGLTVRRSRLLHCVVHPSAHVTAVVSQKPTCVICRLSWLPRNSVMCAGCRALSSRSNVNTCEMQSSHQGSGFPVSLD